MIDGGDVGDALHHAAVGQRHRLERAGDPLRRQIDAECMEEGNHVRRPTDGDGGRADGVLQHQVPADDPGDPFAQGRVGVGVGAAGHGNHAGEFAVAQAGERAADSGHNHGNGDRGTGVLRGGNARQGEQARADDGADSQRDQVARTERSLEMVLTTFRFGNDVADRFGRKQTHVFAFPRQMKWYSNAKDTTFGVAPAALRVPQRGRLPVGEEPGAGARHEGTVRTSRATGLVSTACQKGNRRQWGRPGMVAGVAFCERRRKGRRTVWASERARCTDEAG